MQKILADVLHTIGQAMLTPCLIVLALLMIAALWQIGDVLVEWFKVRRTHKLNSQQRGNGRECGNQGDRGD